MRGVVVGHDVEDVDLLRPGLREQLGRLGSQDRTPVVTARKNCGGTGADQKIAT